MIRYFFVFMLALQLGGATVRATDNFYYDYSTQIPLTSVSDCVIAKEDDTIFTTWTFIYQNNPGLNPLVPPAPVADGFSMFAVNPGYSPDSVVAQLRRTVGILYANKVYQDADQKRFYPTDLLYLHFKTSTSDHKIDSIMSAHSLVLVDSLFGDHFIRIAKTTGGSPYDVITTGNRLLESSLFQIARASFCLPYETFSTPNDSYYEYQWYLKNDGLGGKPRADIHLEEALEYHIPSTPLLVGMLDDGFEDHPDFPAGRIKGGWDYYERDSGIQPGPRRAHGMGCMGILGALRDNSEGVAGIAPFSIQIIGQKIFPDKDTVGAASEVMIAMAFDSCRIKGAKLISNSWGRGCYSCSSSVINAAIRRTDSAGVVIVFSAGNCGGCPWVADPARHPQVLAVGATDREDYRWDYSMYGPELDLVAPSGNINLLGDIWTLDRTGANGYNPSLISCNPQDVDYDCKFGGTSAACPEVSGVIALLMLRRPDLIGRPAAIRELIEATCDDQLGDIKDTPGWDQYYGHGRLNAAKVLSAASRGDVNNDGTVDISDAVYLIARIFSGGPAPVPEPCTGDYNCDGTIDISDAVSVVTYVFAGGQAPCYSGSYSECD